MARGQSGRIVLEVDPELKNELYSAISKKGMTLKDWFVDTAEQYIKYQVSEKQLTFDFLSTSSQNDDKK
ncbi:MAG: hypothetical protein ABIK98_15390 [Pseudomonadota bacterium]|uniref:Uncharacterized protein n=1 Tax=Candidatus Desulfatibia profunda TaxID=2841695 RepID=A0A8J6TMP8_9BACT|nr:hypothetical protein [Candidatus Desulfatibia profunda]MBL7180445.1 hypothetical protein [Desulfobacterales bacterium]